MRGIRQWAAHLRDDLGLGYDEYVLHSYDEQAGATVDEYLLARALIREADPNIRENVTCGSSTTLADVQKMAEPNVIWSPYMGFVNSDDHSVLDFMRATGRPIWPYECGEDKRAWDPEARYRVWPWVLYRERAQGLFLWTYLRANPWDGRSWDGGVVYPGERTVITSRRWDLLRDGLEDYLLLRAADRAGHGDLVRAAEAAVLADRGNAALLRQHREALIRAMAGQG